MVVSRPLPRRRESLRLTLTLFTALRGARQSRVQVAVRAGHHILNRVRGCRNALFDHRCFGPIVMWSSVCFGDESCRCQFWRPRNRHAATCCSAKTKGRSQELTQWSRYVCPMFLRRSINRRSRCRPPERRGALANHGRGAPSSVERRGSRFLSLYWLCRCIEVAKAAVSRYVDYRLMCSSTIRFERSKWRLPRPGCWVQVDCPSPRTCVFRRTLGSRSVVHL